MSYQWGPQGPAFEVQGIYRSENLALLARAGLLGLTAMLVLVLALADLNLPSWMPTKLLRLPQDGQALHVALGLLLLALATIDVLRALRQRGLRLLPGQPGPLVTALRSVNTPNPEAAPLAAALEGGPPPLPPQGIAEWAWLLRGRAALAAAPLGLQAWIGQRIAHLGWIIGLALALLLARVLLGPAGATVMAALCVVLAAVVLLRARLPGRSTPGPRVIALQLALTLAIGLAGAFAPQALTERLAAVGLVEGAALMLAALLLTELVALAAGLVVADRPPTRSPTPAPCTVEIDADVDSVQQEVERELHRYWSEGVPNRRYLWQSNQADWRGSGARFDASSLEESQPLLAAAPAAAGHGGARRPWLLVLLALGLGFTLVGGLLWGVVVWQQLQRATQAWRLGSAAVLFFFAGGYALRVAHLLWSRLEAQSLLLTLACSATATSTVRLRWTVTRARSAFYAAADQGVGSRVLLELTSDETAARRSAQQIKRYAEKINAAEAQEGSPAPATPRPQRAAPPTPATPLPRAPTPGPGPGRRFCVDCGESMAQSARFCPRCGERQRNA